MWALFWQIQHEKNGSLHKFQSVNTTQHGLIGDWTYLILDHIYWVYVSFPHYWITKRKDLWFRMRFQFRFSDSIQPIRITDLRFQWNPIVFNNAYPDSWLSGFIFLPFSLIFILWYMVHVLYVYKTFLSSHCLLAALLQCI